VVAGDVGGAVVVVSAGVDVVPVLVVSVLVVVVVSVLVVLGVLVVSVVAVVTVLVVESVVVGGESARAAAAAPLPKRTIAASVVISLRRAMGRDYRRYSDLLLCKRSGAGRSHSGVYPHARANARLIERPGAAFDVAEGR